MRLEDCFPKRYTFFLCTRNRKTLLAENLQRFRALKKSNDELIVIDGASTDGTVELLAAHGGLIDRYVSEPDRSEGEALNKAVLIAQGRYLKVLTDDDIFHEDAIEKAYVVMEGHPEIDVLVCGGTVGRVGTDEVTARRCVPAGVNYGTHVNDVFDHFRNGLGLVLRHASLPRSGIFSSTAFCLDADYIAQAVSNGACVRFCRLNSNHHIIFSHSTSVAQSRRLQKDYARIARRHGRNDVASMYDPRNPVEYLLGLYYRYHKNFWSRLYRKLTGARAPETTPIWDGGLS
jgi:glycosyltransferase involved in cell wall biosynthesis